MARVTLRVVAWRTAEGHKHFNIGGLEALAKQTFTPGRARRLAEALREIAAEVERRLDLKAAAAYNHALDWGP